MKKTAIVHVYNFIRMSHTEPSRFLMDDFDTLRRILILVKQYGFPGTYALKYDALMEPRYQELLKEYLDENDELGAWWEITEPLCRRAGVSFHDTRQEIEYDDRVDSAYCLGYTPEDRKLLVDAYMADFYEIYGRYPANLGSWVLDSVTIGYAGEKYGVKAACICRDQVATDGFTLWGGWPNGVYYPSRNNAYLPANTEATQLDIPVFRLLGPCPIYCFEDHVRRENMQGVVTMEPAWLPGRDPRFVTSFFGGMTEEDALGIQYCQVGQENNFLWDNIQPGLEAQLQRMVDLVREGKIRVETMGATGEWFRKQYRLTPPATFQRGYDWSGNGLSAQWYACVNYRLGLLGEEGHLRIRDLFVYRDDYACRYLREPIRTRQSLFDAPPVMWPQAWGGPEDRPYIRLVDEGGNEPTGEILYDTIDDTTARARLLGAAELHMDQQGLTVMGSCALRFDRLPVLKEIRGREFHLEYEGFRYGFAVERGIIDGLTIRPEDGVIRLILGAAPGVTRREEEAPIPAARRSASRPVPPRVPVPQPGESVLPWGVPAQITLTAMDEGEIRYTLDGSVPAAGANLYTQPITITDDTVLSAVLVTPQGAVSELGRWHYRFSRKDLRITSPTKLDERPVFGGNGLTDLLRPLRGTTDYLDHCWRGSLEDIDVTAEFEPGMVESVAMGFLSQHRGGVVYPKTVELYTGPDRDHLTLKEIVTMPDGPGEREIERCDAVFAVNERIGAIRVVARRHARMPQWCTYRGTTKVFTMTDCLIVRPGEEDR